MASTPTSNCTIARPDPRQLWDRIASRFSATVLGGADLIPESNEWYVTALNFAMAEEFYAYADQLYKETDPRTACCDNLVALASDWGMYPTPASFSEGYVQLKGTARARLTAPLTMQAGGVTFVSVGRVPGRLNAQGTAIVRFRSLEAGPEANIRGVSSGRLVDPPAGVLADVTIAGGQFCGGEAEESCEAFRQRFINRMAYRPQATNAWLVDKLGEWPCVTRVCARGGSCCVGDPLDDMTGCNCAGCQSNSGNDFYVLFDDTFECGAAPSCVLEEIQEWMFGPDGLQGRGMGQAPIGVCGKIHPVTPGRFSVMVDVHSCLSSTEAEDLEEALREYLRTVCPSTPLLHQNLVLVLGQVLGVGVGFTLTLIPGDSSTSVNDCGDLIPKCDVNPCVTGVTFTSPEAPTCL